LFFVEERGVQIVTENILYLMQNLACENEIGVDFEQAYFYK
jgi:hypothetical protein